MECKAEPGCFDNFCRICSCQNEKGKLTYIFENDYLLEKITSFLPITIHQNDELPHHVCGKCLNGIESCFDLIKRAQSSEKFFFNRLKNAVDVKIKTEEGIEEYPTENNGSRSIELDGTFSCDLCDARLPDAEELDKHIQNNHINAQAPPNTEFTIRKICSLCGELFESDEIYMLHKCESTPSCPQCNKTMSTKCLLNRHINNFCKQLFFCPHCYKKFTSKLPFMKHMQAHSGLKIENDCLACEQKVHGNGEATEHTCDKGFSNSSAGKRYKCYICGQAYKRQINLAKHCQQHQPKTDWTFKCSKCNDVFEKEKSLHAHYEKVHKMSKTWICRYCGKSMSTKLSVQIHERIHTNVKPYVCEWCGNAFRSKANLIQHHAKHTGVRKHTCPVCGKMFSRTFFLKTHMRTHTGERPYQCDVCEQRFTQVGDMRRHRRRHEAQSQARQPPPQPAQVQPTVIIVRRGSPGDRIFL
ncbi:zinc finger protein OZF-like isoform X2 [Macrosteles quadrilineatus]|uniref:zinc finger protein OZF-like isoform X1 n=1 Tax=Macrosteles quadrilineatus TaxID=74068 RepID=UPI0023E1C7AA|nr:zinc finger protein OZF-like isoform X1 [Macrosteles quadrilineatus]XP_054265965.1 zinc finger protein OZF-like isoform X1 [Macrosteles quadrilineatus]XP_054269486.1 zinc finger protein OZF-like isoform X2 [Macrosteles quadrilineatus]